MKYLKLISLLFIVTLGSLFASCEETAVVNEYANWQERNTLYIDSIAKVAKSNSDKWLRILSYKLDSIDVNGKYIEHNVEDYVYCYVEKRGENSGHPLSSATVNYRGRLIPTDNHPMGKVFDESYTGTLNPATNAPVEFSLNDVIEGWSTALMHMGKGDIWHVYIPANLGYGNSNKTDIPAYSTLIFDINLVDFE